MTIPEMWDDWSREDPRVVTMAEASALRARIAAGRPITEDEYDRLEYTFGEYSTLGDLSMRHGRQLLARAAW